MLLLMFSFTNMLSSVSNLMMVKENDYAGYVEQITENQGEVKISEEDFNKVKEAEIDLGALLESEIYRMLLWLIPCLAITGPFTAGLSYVTRNWARDEHAFIWTDFKDAVKENWKQALVLSAITSIMPFLAYLGWKYYGRLADTSAFMIVPQVLVALVAIIWSISITYMYPLTVTYQLKLKDIIRNGILLGVARLPMSVGIRLLHCVPAVIGALLIYLWSPMIGMMILFAYYVLIGFSLSRFITASYTNAVFDRYINPRIEGAKVNQGLYQSEDDDEAEEETEGDTDN